MLYMYVCSTRYAARMDHTLRDSERCADDVAHGGGDDASNQYSLCRHEKGEPAFKPRCDWLREKGYVNGWLTFEECVSNI